MNQQINKKEINVRVKKKHFTIWGLFALGWSVPPAPLLRDRSEEEFRENLAFWSHSARPALYLKR